MNNVVALDNYRKLEDIIKERLKVEEVVVLGDCGDGNFLSFVPNSISDLSLVYMIQTLKDIRQRRMNEVNS